jgi:hypothetical protein
MLRRYWIHLRDADKFAGLRLGCGVTAFDLDDALALLRTQVIGDQPFDVEAVVEDVDVRALDPGHVLPNMGVVARRGIWFPLSHERGT